LEGDDRVAAAVVLPKEEANGNGNGNGNGEEPGLPLE
jgi:hypothetical protein